jgi:tetratricopeptide (TPR) repeat protein
MIFTTFLCVAALASLPHAVVADGEAAYSGFDRLAATKQTTSSPEDGAAAPRPGAVVSEAVEGLTPELIYAVLVGQIAHQRGEHRIAFTHFIQAAEIANDAGLAEQATRESLALGDAVSTERAIAVWLAVAPSSIAAHQIAAFVRLQAEDIEGAMAYLRKLINLASDKGQDGFIQAARLVHKIGPPERRLELMETLTKGDSDNPDAWFARALVAAGAERYTDAERAALRAAELRSDWTEPRLFLVQVLLDQGKRQAARETLERFVAENPKDQGLRMLYAQMLVDEKDYARARNVFELMVEETPEEPDVLFALGILSLQLEDLSAARDYFTRLDATGERRGEAAYYLGQVEELAEDFEAAVSWYNKVEGEHALDAKVRVARLRARQGDLDQARQLVQQLRDQLPDDAVPLYMVEAEILAEMERDRDAMAIYDAALAAYPDNVDLLYARALHAVGMRRLDILERDLRAILAIQPDHADALNALGYTLADQTDRYEEALALIQRALALKPEDPAVLDSMGWVQYRLGNLDEAAHYLAKALELLPDGEIAAHLGEVLWAMGKRDEAWKVWEGALAQDPDHEYLLRVIGRHRYSRSDAQPQ